MIEKSNTRKIIFLIASLVVMVLSALSALWLIGASYHIPSLGLFNFAIAWLVVLLANFIAWISIFWTNKLYFLLKICLVLNLVPIVLILLWFFLG
jgi:hypothetical protein